LGSCKKRRKELSPSSYHFMAGVNYRGGPPRSRRSIPPFWSFPLLEVFSQLDLLQTPSPPLNGSPEGLRPLPEFCSTFSVLSNSLHPIVVFGYTFHGPLLCTFFTILCFDPESPPLSGQPNDWHRTLQNSPKDA